jgi:hypothetical protein
MNVHMDDDRHVQHELDVLRDEHAREMFALRRVERSSQAEARMLDRRLRELAEQQDRAARRLETEYRETHFGKSPVSWPAHERSER